MHIAAAVTGYLIFIFLGGALLAPGAYYGLHKLAVSFPVLNWLADHAFHRYLSRCFTIMAVVGLWPFLRRIGVRSFSDIGFSKDVRRGRRILLGFALGWGLLFAAALLTWVCGIRAVSLNHGAGDVLRHIRNAGLASLFAAVFEEAIFRGVFFMALRAALGVPVAIGLSSVLYALAHFTGSRAGLSEVTWLSGLQSLTHFLGGVSESQNFLAMLCNLAIAGVILACACNHYGNVYFSVGLHAGFIFWVKSFGFFTRPTGAGLAWFWGGSKLIDGWLAFGLLAGFLAACLGLFSRGRPGAPPKPTGS